MRRRGQKRSKIGWIVLLLFIFGGVGAGTIYLYTADEFEQIPPKIEMPRYNYWNTKDPLKVVVSDNIGIKSYQVTLGDGSKEIVVARGNNLVDTKHKEILVKYPKTGLDRKAKTLYLSVTVNDSSKWNYLNGNEVSKKIPLKIDYRRPNVNIVSNSYSVTQGGSALVIFQASDDDKLAELFIETTNNRFKVQPYKKSGYFVSLIAWPFKDDNFQAKVVAKDRAGNKRAVVIPFYVKSKSYRTSTIKASDKFIDGKITDLAEQDSKYMKSNKLERLKAINETMRIDNEKLIHKYTSNLSKEILDSWKIKRFYPLKNGKKVANFGDHRYYYYKKKSDVISESYHLGYDMASTKMAPIVSSNSGKVVFSDYNGIYGNMPIIDHGLGLYTLYGHCSTVDVKEGDEVKAGEIIAKTGMTGLALGDHLHFGMLVQGIEVRPVEWLDSKWIRDNIDKIFNDADVIIGTVSKKDNSIKVSDSKK